MIEPSHDQCAEQVVVGRLYPVVADAVEQRSVDEFRSDEANLALAQTRKYLVVTRTVVLPDLFFFFSTNMVQRYSFFPEYEVSMVFCGENSPSSLHKKWCEVTQNDPFLIVINLIYNIVIFYGQNRTENRSESICSHLTRRPSSTFLPTIPTS